ncbi:MAG TPA: hypothetical protein VLE97_11105 [Gaiellaceae bacterium]|nr:hypothetical protein [Gaiellaceae bacterium]
MPKAICLHCGKVIDTEKRRSVTGFDMLVDMTAKQISGYLKAKKAPDGISFNDGYNKATYGITKADFDEINRAMHAEYGMFPVLTPAGVKKALEPLSPGGAPRYALRGHATKKSPAQLQREINEALRRRAMSLDPAQVGREITEGFARQRALEEALTSAQRAYVAALGEDVRLFPDAYKADVRADPGAWAVKLAEGLSDADAREMAREQRAETKRTLRTLGRTSHATKRGTRYKVFEYHNQREPVTEFGSLRLAKAHALERSAHKLKWNTRKELRREGEPWVTVHYSDDRYFIEEA